MFFFFKQKTAYEMRISDWSSDVCSSDLSQSDNNCVESSNCRVFLRSDRTVAARPIKERSKRQRASAATGPAKAPNPRRQRLWRDIALILIAPLLLYLLASLLSFSPSDPGWSHSGSLTAPLHNVGGRSEEHTSELQSLLRISYAVFR